MDHKDPRLTSLRSEVDDVNERILALVQRRAEIVLEIARLKQAMGLEGYDPKREEEMLHHLTARSEGPFGPAGDTRNLPGHLPRVARHSEPIVEGAAAREAPRSGPGGRDPRSRRRDRGRNARADRGSVLGRNARANGGDRLVLRPAAGTEDPARRGVQAAHESLLVPGTARGGAEDPARRRRPPRPGHRDRGARPASLELVAAYADMVQIGARNMYNTELLKAVGRLGKPVLLKRGFMATLEEFLLSAEYILSEGNHVDRPVRARHPHVRALDAQHARHLGHPAPQAGDVAAGDRGREPRARDGATSSCRAPARRWPQARTGSMIEAHPSPDQALSDGFQQLNLDEFEDRSRGSGWTAPRRKPAPRRSASGKAR